MPHFDGVLISAVAEAAEKVYSVRRGEGRVNRFRKAEGDGWRGARHRQQEAGSERRGRVWGSDRSREERERDKKM